MRKSNIKKLNKYLSEEESIKLEHKIHKKSHNNERKYNDLFCDKLTEIKLCKNIANVCLNYKVTFDSPFFDIYREKFNIDNTFLTEEIKSVKGVYKCNRCKSDECLFTQLQKSSCDEGFTTYISCVKCGNKWKER